MTTWKLAAIAVIAAGGLLAWVALDLLRPISQNLRQFDPEEVAQLDTDMWRSYYDKERLKLFNQLAVLLRHQYHMPMIRSYVGAFRAAKAAFVFKDGTNRGEYERALPDLIAYYAAIRKISKTPFDVERAARLELEWWIVHRERNRLPAGSLDHALADLAAEIYQMPAERFAEHARYRADAMVMRDDLAEGKGVSDSDWETIHGLLRRSWNSLWHAVNDAEPRL
jgi:hypothetical protein